jgi:hypothetical protein
MRGEQDPSGKGAAMSTNRERDGAGSPRGNLLRLGDGREIAIYRHDDMAWVTEFSDGYARIFAASDWFCVNRGGRALRSMELATIQPLSDDLAQRIERLHQRRTQARGPLATSPEVATVVDAIRGRLASLLGSLLGRRPAHS